MLRERRLTPSQRERLRIEFVRLRYRERDAIEAVAGLVTEMLLIARRLPRNARYVVAEAMRDAADQLERMQ